MAEEQKQLSKENLKFKVEQSAQEIQEAARLVDEEEENSPSSPSARDSKPDPPSTKPSTDKNHWLIPWLRLGALLADQTIIWGTILLTACLLGSTMLLHACGFFFEHSELMARASVVVFFVLLLFGFLAQYFLYAAIFESSQKQATPGMRVFGLISSSPQGTPLTFNQVLRRQAAQHGILLFSGSLSCALYLLLSNQIGGNFLFNMLPFLPLIITFGLSLIRKDGRNLFDLLGGKIVRTVAEVKERPRIITMAENHKKQMGEFGFAHLYWRLNLGLTAFLLFFSTVFNLAAVQSLEQSCRVYESQPQTASHNAQKGLENYYFIKALVSEFTGNRELANRNFDRAIAIKDRSLFQFEKARNLHDLGRLDETIEAGSHALALMEAGKQDNALCKIRYGFGKGKEGLAISTAGEELSLENLLILRGRTYLELKADSKYFHKAGELGRKDLNRAIAIVGKQLEKEHEARLYRHRAELHELAGNRVLAEKDREAAALRQKQEVELKVDGVTIKAGTTEEK